jgi:hypothetical protein
VSRPGRVAIDVGEGVTLALDLLGIGGAIRRSLRDTRGKTPAERIAAARAAVLPVLDRALADLAAALED